MTSNQAVVGKAVAYNGTGGPEAVELIERTIRAPGAGEVRIAVKAAAVSPTDILYRDPGYPNQVWPALPGMDAAGVIEAVGPGETRLTIGEAVMAAVMPVRPEGGAQSQYIVVPAASVVPIPDGLSMTVASTLPMNGLTALRAIELAALQPGQVLAISGGAGFLAGLATSLAKEKGLKVIVDAKPEDEALVRGYGADIIVRRGPDFASEVRRVIPEGADALLDTALLGTAAFAALRDGGVYIPVRGWRGDPAERNIAIKPVLVSEVLERTAWLEELREMAQSGKLTLQVAGEYPVERTADAQRALAAGGLRGRPVLLF